MERNRGEGILVETVEWECRPPPHPSVILLGHKALLPAQSLIQAQNSQQRQMMHNLQEALRLVLRPALQTLVRIDIFVILSSKESQCCQSANEIWRKMDA